MIEFYTLKVFDSDGKIIGEKQFLEFPEFGDIEDGIKMLGGVQGSVVKMYEILPFA